MTKEINSGEWWIVEGREIYVSSFVQGIDSIKMDGDTYEVNRNDTVVARCSTSVDGYGPMPPIFTVELEAFEDAKRMEPQPEGDYRGSHEEEHEDVDYRIEEAEDIDD